MMTWILSIGVGDLMVECSHQSWQTYLQLQRACWSLCDVDANFRPKDHAQLMYVHAVKMGSSVSHLVEVAEGEGCTNAEEVLFDEDE